MIEMLEEPSIGIIGGGPRCLFALERLWLELLRTETLVPINITVYEPALTPGAGFVYSLDQPDFLRMNFASRHIDIWSRVETATADLPSLTRWLSDHPRWAGADGFVPRAIVGQYLSEAFTTVCAKLEDLGVTVNVCKQKVTQIKPGWKLTTESGESNSHTEVLLCTGHEGWRRSSRGVDSVTATIADVFPVDVSLSESKVRTGSVVAIEGFGLTMIDAVLAMTEGRGGRFIDDCYVASGFEPRSIRPFSRTGRPMLSKPEPYLMNLPNGLEGVWQRGRSAASGAAMGSKPTDLFDTLWIEILGAADDALRVTGRELEDGYCASWFREWKGAEASPEWAIEQMRHSHQVAIGKSKPGASWALAEAWRQLYTPLATALSHGGLAASAWPGFQKIAVEMERIAFGPPALNVGKLLALIDSGIVDLGNDDGSDIIVKALIPSPTEPAHDSLLDQLLEQGWVRRMKGCNAIEIAEDARVINNDGSTTPGLSILGRATEGCVVGNDTLSRKLHYHPSDWAVSVVRSIEAAHPKPELPALRVC